MAVSFLLLVIAMPLLAAIRWLCRVRLTPWQWLLWSLAYLLVKFRWRARWEGELDLPAGQGAILVSNHRSSVDPFFLQTATTRKVHWLVAREYCAHPAIAWFLRSCEVIPVGRGGVDTAATKGALRLAAAGGIVGMFPEGRINMTDELLLPCRPGAALVALKARVPLVPCYIEGSPYDRFPHSPLLMTARVKVRFGKPLDLSDCYGREAEPGMVEQVMRRCLAEIARLAGEPDFEPRLAGRNWKPTEEELAAATSSNLPRRDARR